MSAANHARGQKGFRPLSALALVAVVAVLASFAQPVIRDARSRAVAARILADVGTIRKAASILRLETGAYPASAAWTEVPAELADRLDGMSFENNGIWYMWWAPGRYRGVLVYTLGDPKVLQLVTDTYTGRDFNWGRFAYLVIDQERI